MQSLQADQSLYNRKGVCYFVQLSVFRRSRRLYLLVKRANLLNIVGKHFPKYVFSTIKPRIETILTEKKNLFQRDKCYYNNPIIHLLRFSMKGSIFLLFILRSCSIAIFISCSLNLTFGTFVIV